MSVCQVVRLMNHLVRHSARTIPNFARLDTSTRRAISWRRTMRRGRTSVHRGVCRRMRRLLRLSRTAMRRGQRAMACMVVSSRVGERMPRRASFFLLLAAAAIPASSTPAHTAATGPLRRLWVILTTHGSSTSVRATSVRTTTIATAGGLFVRFEILLSSV